MDTHTHEKTKKVQLRGESSRKKVLAAAGKILKENGFEQASVAAIVQASGVSNGSFYHHFGSKQGVLEQLIEAFCEEGRARFDSICGDEKSFDDRLKACVRAGVAQFKSNPQLYRTMAQQVQVEPEIWEPMRDLRQYYEDRILLLIGPDIGPDPRSSIQMMTQVLLATLTHTVLFSSGPIVMDMPDLEETTTTLAKAILNIQTPAQGSL